MFEKEKELAKGLEETVRRQAGIIARRDNQISELVDEIKELKVSALNEYEKGLGHIPVPEDRRDMSGFVAFCVSACWAAYAEVSHLLDSDYRKREREGVPINESKYNARQSVKSWLYDAASVLTVVSHDGKLLSLLSEWYERDGGIPWNKEGDWRQTDER